MAIRMGARGFTVRQIVKAMNAAGYRTTGNWGQRRFSKDTVLPMLKNRFYLGLVCYKGAWLPGKHRAAIDRRTWNQCQAHLRRRAWKCQVHIGPNHRYPLRGMLRCASCGRTLRGSRGKDGHRYRDPAKDYASHCPQLETTKAEFLERQIVECLEFIGALPCWKRNARGFGTKGRKRPTDEGMSHCIEKLERIKHLYIIGDMAPKEYVAERQRIHLELEGEVHSSAYYGDSIFPLLRHFRERWDAASKLERNIMLQAILEKGWVDHGRIVAIELKPVVHSIVASHASEVRARQNIMLLPPESDFKPRKKR